MNNDQRCFHFVTFAQTRKEEVPILGIHVKEEEEAITGEMFGSVFLQKAQVMFQKHGHWCKEGFLAYEEQGMYKGHNC
jgi:hypothetical protein